MNIKLMQKTCTVVFAIYAVFCALLYWIGGDNLRFKETEGTAVTASATVGEITEDCVISQRFAAPGDELLGLTLRLSTFARENDTHLEIDVKDESGQMLAHSSLPTAGLTDNAEVFVSFDNAVQLVKKQTYLLEIRSPDGREGNAVSLWYGNTYTLMRGEAVKKIPEGQCLLVNGAEQNGMLCFSLKTRSYFWIGQHWPIIALTGAVALLALSFRLLHKAKKGQVTFLHRIIDGFQRYSFLMRQLVSRDFKTKYKRSVLGVLWSFLNPLLTMGVQFVVFSTLFRSNIPNFPLYLLSGIVCYNFFSEATSMSLVSIVGNAHLITKVYVPKYIYPVSRVLSSTINLLLALIPLLGVMILTRARFTPALLMLPYGLICLVGLSIGIAFILSTSMVFFRDTQFLWSVLIMLWMYMTPIFYPETIIPERFLPLYHCNPLYQIIHFLRSLLIDGVSPDPNSYLLCALAAIIPLLIGSWVFKKNQDKFILNL